MLTVSHVWSNAAEPDEPFGLWLVGVEPNGSWWWLLVGVAGKGLGLRGVDVRRIASPADVRRAIAEDDLGAPAWSAIEPERAIGLIDAEFARAKGTQWSHDYPEAFAKVEAEYRRIQDALRGAHPVEPYSGTT